jgi:hypothetical protein
MKKGLIIIILMSTVIISLSAQMEFDARNGILVKYRGNKERVVIPNSVTVIGSMAFWFHDSISEIIIPESVKAIDNNAIYGCNGLISIIIPKNVVYIGSLNFTFCERLTSITVVNDNRDYCSIDGILFSKDKKEILAYPAGKINSNYSIPPSVFQIGDGSFGGCKYLRTIQLSSNIISIGAGAFSSCTNLSSITMPSSIKFLESDAFSGCSSLITVTIPKSVIKIGNSPFSDCKNLTNIFVEEDNLFYISDDGILYTKDTTEIIQYPAGKKDVTFKISPLVKIIGDAAFCGCSYLRQVDLSSIERIEYAAFLSCTNLFFVVIPRSVYKIGDSAFSMCANLETAHVPNTTFIGQFAFPDGCKIYYTE